MQCKNPDIIQDETLRKRKRHKTALQSPSSRSGLVCSGSTSAYKIDGIIETKF